MKKCLRIVVRSCFVVAVVVGSVILVSSRPDKFNVTEDGFKKITDGMTRGEVIAVLGCRPRYAAGELKLDGPGYGGTLSSMMTESEGEVWESNDCRIHVVFDQDGKAIGKKWTTHTPAEETFCQKLSRWAGVLAR